MAVIIPTFHFKGNLYYFLNHAGYCYVRDFMDTNEKSLLRIAYVGPKTAKDILDMVEKFKTEHKDHLHLLYSLPIMYEGEEEKIAACFSPEHEKKEREKVNYPYGVLSYIQKDLLNSRYCKDRVNKHKMNKYFEKTPVEVLQADLENFLKDEPAKAKNIFNFIN